MKSFLNRAGNVKVFNPIWYQYRSLVCFYPTISQLNIDPPSTNSLVSTKGHIKSIREFKNIKFIDISDGSGHENLSIVVRNPEMVLSNVSLKVGQSVEAVGKWIESTGKQDFELLIGEDSDHKMEIIGDVTDLYPLQKKSTSFHFLRSVPTLRHRTSSLASILRFRSFIESKFFEYYNKNGFIKVNPPLITSSDCEGAGEQFVVESLKIEEDKDQELFFDKPAYLTVSTQLHLEVLALSLNRVWTMTPCFRAENSKTNRHLSEFWMLEAEICYIEDLHQLTAFVEDMIRFIVTELKSKKNKIVTSQEEDLVGSRFNKNEVKEMSGRWSTLLSPNKWPTITYSEAIDIINKIKNKGRSKGRLQWGSSLQTEDEKWLAGSHFNSPVFITDYPLSEKPFYMPKSKSFDPERPTVSCFDLIVPEIGELVGGSLREHNYDSLILEMNRRNMKIDDMEWYTSTRKNGSVPHGGFGMGIERLVSYLGAIENIKDVIPFPRYPGSCQC